MNKKWPSPKPEMNKDQWVSYARLIVSKAQELIPDFAASLKKYDIVIGNIAVDGVVVFIGPINIVGSKSCGLLEINDSVYIASVNGSRLLVESCLERYALLMHETKDLVEMLRGFTVIEECE